MDALRVGVRLFLRSTGLSYFLEKRAFKKLSDGRSQIGNEYEFAKRLQSTPVLNSASAGSGRGQSAYSGREWRSGISLFDGKVTRHLMVWTVSEQGW